MLSVGDRTSANESAHAIFRHERETFGCFDHLVKGGVHEIQGASELTSSKVAFPHLQGNALCGVPCIGAESRGTGELFTHILAWGRVWMEQGVESSAGFKGSDMLFE